MKRDIHRIQKFIYLYLHPFTSISYYFRNVFSSFIRTNTIISGDTAVTDGHAQSKDGSPYIAVHIVVFLRI